MKLRIAVMVVSRNIYVIAGNGIMLLKMHRKQLKGMPSKSEQEPE
jgi:hypothetical protein